MLEFNFTDKDLNNVEDILVNYEKYKILNYRLLERICNLINDFLNDDIFEINHDNSWNEIYGFISENNKNLFNEQLFFNNHKVCDLKVYYDTEDELNKILDFVNTKTEFKTL